MCTTPNRNIAGRKLGHDNAQYLPKSNVKEEKNQWKICSTSLANCRRYGEDRATSESSEALIQAKIMFRLLFDIIQTSFWILVAIGLLVLLLGWCAG